MKNHSHTSKVKQYNENSLTLVGAGTGVIIGAGILALTGKIAKMAWGIISDHLCRSRNHDCF
jgi:hypothetical protein